MTTSTVKRRFPVLLAVALSVAFVPVSAADGAPVDDKRAQAAQLQAAIDENGRKIDSTSEEANGARYRLDQATAAAADAQARIAVAAAEADRLRGVLRERAVSVYKGSGSSSPLDAINVRNARQYAARSKYASAAANRQNDLVDRLRDAKDELSARKSEYEATIAQAEAEQQRIEAARSEIEAANAKQAQLLSQVTGEIATLVQQEEQRKEAEAAARALAITTPSPAPRAGAPTASRPASRTSAPSRGSAPRPPPSGPVPGASSGASAAIAFARAQIGKPYVYAAAGPDSFDCSGLTMRAWAAGGVSMPHYSGAQAAMFPRVPLDAMQPGDLVFWGPGGRDHIGLYVG
ncbi:MAG: NlpC/P60 family protein, partial [Cryobacterium sp.]|nr:NlpC/P60 family protein [Cryobacterium sp.]